MTNPRNAYGKAALKALENARQLLDLAEHSMKDGASGHAYSLAIMAHEELAKAYVSWTVSLGVIEPEDDLVTAVYSDHVAKNWIMLSYHISVALRDEARMGLRDSDDELKAILETPWERIRQFEEEVNEELKKESIDMEMRRREGFYVNVLEHEDFRVTSPQDFTYDRAENTCTNVMEAFNAINTIIILANQNEGFRKFFTELLIRELEGDYLEN